LVGTGDVVLVVLALAGQTNSAATLDLFLPTSGDRPFYGAMVERRDGPSWLRDDNDDDDDGVLEKVRPITSIKHRRHLFI